MIRLTDDILKAGAAAGKKEIFSRPNLVHQATQKILNNCGFVPCAAVYIFDTESEHVLCGHRAVMVSRSGTINMGG